MPLNILHEDDTLLVLEKPAGISVSDDIGPTIADLLVQQRPGQGNLERAGIAHRLDKETSGVLLAAKTPKELGRLQKLFEDRRIGKTYLSLVAGVVKEQGGVLDAPLARSPKDRRKQRVVLPTEPGAETARQALTEYKVLKRFEDYTLLEVSPKTGRRHQIRAHMASLGHPVAGDRLYGFKGQKAPKGLTRQFLHASSVRFDHKEFSSKLPDDLQKVVDELT